MTSPTCSFTFPPARPARGASEWAEMGAARGDEAATALVLAGGFADSLPSGWGARRCNLTSSCRVIIYFVLARGAVDSAGVEREDDGGRALRLRV